MDKTYKQKIIELQQQPQKIYNICMIAHVDHGKTSLSDALISSNKIFSRKMNGKYLYMDFRQDEQERQITMKSSAITLLSPSSNHLINLIDSPGHIDFQFEVVSGLKITDGAILIIDSVEGIGSQTINLMKQAVENNMKLILFLNKIDKLISLLEMDSHLIYNQLNSIIETANAFMNIYLESKVQCELEKNPKHNEKHLREIFKVDSYFSPLSNNVIFGSVRDAWAFRTKDLAISYAEKWGMNPDLLQKYFWGEFYLDLKNKKLTKNDKTGKLQPIFVQYVLNILQKIYQAQKNKDFQTLTKIASKLGLSLREKELNKSQNQILQEIMFKWLPVDQCVYSAITEILPNALEGQQKRINQISENWVGHEPLKRGIMSCRMEGPPIAVITKVFQINIDNQDRYVGFGRLYQGTLKKNDQVMIHNSKKEKVIIKMNYLYFWMGQTPIEIEEVAPGNIFGFCDLNVSQYKASYFGPDDCPNLLPILSEQTLIKVRIRSEKLEDMEKLIYGLKVLNNLDPVCDVYNDSKGDYILQVNGEIHLERCLTDLKGYIPGVGIQLSEILVDFRETVQNQNYNLEKKFDEESSLEEESEEEENNAEKNSQKEDKIEQQKQIQIKKIKEEEEKKEKIQEEKIVKKTKKDLVRFEEEDFDYDYLKEEETEEQKQQKALKEEEEFFEQDDEVDRGSLNSLDFEDDSRFKMKKVNFVYKDIKAQTKDVLKKTKNFKTRRFDLLEKVRAKKNYARISTPDNKLQFEVQCLKLPEKITLFLTDQETLMKEAFNVEKKKNLTSFFTQLLSLVNTEIQNPYLKVLLKKHLDCFGPRLHGANLFINACLDPKENLFSRHSYPVSLTPQELKTYKKLSTLLHFTPISKEQAFAFHSELNIGFHQALLKGPLCGEQIHGCIFILDSVRLEGSALQLDTDELEELVCYIEENSVQILRTITQACHDSYLGAGPQLVQSVYEIKAFCDEKTQSQFCDLIKKKNGRVVDREYRHEFNLILVEALLPVHESYGLYSDILKATSGKVVPQMKFGGWETLEQDPFFGELLSEELKEDHGEDFKIKNYAKEIVEQVRKRKGMTLNQKIVEDGDKQINLSKKA